MASSIPEKVSERPFAKGVRPCYNTPLTRPPGRSGMNRQKERADMFWLIVAAYELFVFFFLLITGQPPENLPYF